MLIKILLNYICGYVNISIEGYYIEKFINMCISKRIFLWNMRREKSTFLLANISIKDFKRLKTIIKKTKCKVEINRKSGIPFLLNKYRKRKIFIIAFLIITILVFITSRFIWHIEISGNERISTEDILESLKDSGLKLGIYKSKINTQNIIRKIRLDRDDIAWMSIDVNGTNAIVKIVENTRKPDIMNKTDYCNIVANKSGVIEKISAKTGTIMVNVGDVVKEGTLLVARLDGRKIYGKKVST